MKKIWWFILGLFVVAILVVVLHLLGFFWYGASSEIKVDTISPHEEIVLDDVSMNEEIII